MRSLTSTLLFCMIAFISNAQKPKENIRDSAFAQDSVLITDMKENVTDNIPIITVDESEFTDAGSQNISSLLTAGREPFYTAAAYYFSPLRFRIRGYDADFSVTYMNGIPVYNIDNGLTPFGQWSWLNDVMRNREVVTGLRPTTYAFGAPGISTNIDARASKQKKQTSFGYAFSNRNYNHRWTLTHSSGISKKGWAFCFSLSRRWADEGYIPGTYYNGWSYFAGVDKRLDQKNLLSLVVFGAPTENGRSGATVTEIMDLAGTHYYNPYWGFQNGKKRNANVARSNQPVIIFTHDHRFNNNTTLVTAAGYSFGNRSISGLDWYNAPDPRPDYYRYLPGYQTDAALKQQVTDLFVSEESARQIDWENLYNTNREHTETIYNANGTDGNSVTGKRALYVLQDRVTNTQKINVNAVVNSRLSEHADISAGLSYQWQQNHYYQQLNDLLGGEFYVDLNQFAERDFPNDPNAAQNDLNNPNRIIRVGDKYGYNYHINISRTAAWSQNVFRYNHFDFFAAFEISETRFYRTGNVRNGLFPDDSYGRSVTNIFKNRAFKAGITYKINGRNYIYANVADITRPPYFDNAYISPRTRDFEQPALSSESIQSAEAGYILNAPKIKLRIGGYYTAQNDALNVLTFYHETYRSFVNYALSNIDKLYVGGEFGFEASAAKNISVSGAAALGRYYYSSRQHATITLDNTAETVDDQTVYSENFRVAGTPQNAYSISVSYRSPKFWFLSLTANYFDQDWLDFNPVRRTEAAIDGVDPKTDQWKNILAQTMLPPQHTLDFFGGYSLKLHSNPKTRKAVYLSLSGGVSNLLNDKNIISGGYEQLRFDFDTHDPNKFPAKYYYAYGLNYFISATIRL